jgi:hypothetical protein
LEVVHTAIVRAGAVIICKGGKAGSTKRDADVEFYGLPPIGQKQRRPMDGAQFYFPAE